VNVENLRRIRVSKGLSQRETAKQLQISQQRYNQYETGKRQPDNNTLSMIADFFDCSTDYLLGNGTKTKPPSDVERQSEREKLDKILHDLSIQCDALDLSDEDSKDMDSETKDLILEVLRVAIAMSKKIIDNGNMQKDE